MSKDGEKGLVESHRRSKEVHHTTVIRISDTNYEKLRTQAFHERKPIRQLADELIGNALKKT